jgi:hypothetical protein
VRFATSAVCLVLLAGCSSNASTATTGPSPESGASQQVEIKEVVPGPERLQVLSHAQIAPAAGVPVVYVQMMREPDFGTGNRTYPRSVRLWLKVGTSGGAAFDTRSMRAWFSASDRRRSVASASCGSKALPSVIGPESQQVYGCVAYYLPKPAGRLQIRGEGPPGDPFAYYLPVNALRT